VTEITGEMLDEIARRTDLERGGRIIRIFMG
jgi:hypothetical protein